MLFLLEFRGGERDEEEDRELREEERDLEDDEEL